MRVMNLDPTLSSDCEELHFELFNSDAHITVKVELVICCCHLLKDNMFTAVILQ